MTKAFPLGRWVHQQRKILRAGELEPRRKELLDAPEAEMVWEPGEEAWETKLAARTRNGPPYAQNSWPRSTRTGTAPGHWTDNATAAP